MSKSSNWFSYRRLVVVGLAFIVLVIGATSQASSATGLDLNGKDLEDSGTVIWDASNSYIPAAQIDNSGLAGSDLSVNGDSLDVDAANIQSGTTASDVGLGNVQNEAQVAESGDEALSSGLKFDSGNLILDRSKGYIANDITGTASVPDSSNEYIKLPDGNITLNSGSNQCYLEGSDGSWNCDGNKNWVHGLNETHDSYYSSQESPEVRAVYEGKTSVDGATRVELPSHFSKTVSDSEPKLRATATVQGELAYAAVIEKTDEYIVLDSSEPAAVNYRITGVRDGYEDKQVVRPKQEE